MDRLFHKAPLQGRCLTPVTFGNLTFMDNDRKLLISNKPHLLGKHYPAACSVLTLAEQAPLLFEKGLCGQTIISQ